MDRIRSHSSSHRHLTQSAPTLSFLSPGSLVGLRVFRTFGRDPLNLIQVMLAKGCVGSAFLLLHAIPGSGIETVRPVLVEFGNQKHRNLTMP